MASKTRVTPREEMLDKEGPETPPDSPLIDRSNASVRALIRTAKKRGYVAHDQINSLMKEVNSDQIEDVFAMLNEMGIDVMETEAAETEETSEEAREEPEEEESEGELVEVARTTPAETKKSEPGERTDDPVRMYLREMGSVELLSREGEIAIAKRIEAGREAMIAGLCESPLTFQAIIIWRDELNDGKVFLRDIIDLEATYAGPDAKNVPALAPGDGPGNGAAGAAGGAQPQTVAPATAPAAATPFRPKPDPMPGEEGGEPPEGELDDDDRPVLDDELLSVPLRQPLSHRTCEGVKCTAGGKADDQAHRLCRICLRACDPRYGRQCNSTGSQMQKSTAGNLHHSPPVHGRFRRQLPPARTCFDGSF
jgi:RNA polymerase primary sigma factor